MAKQVMTQCSVAHSHCVPDDCRYKILSWKLELKSQMTTLKGVIGCWIHFTSCLNINVWRVHIHPIMIKIHSVFFFFISILKSSFSNQAVLRFLSEWRSSPTIIDWQDRLTIDSPWVIGELSAIVLTPVQGKTGTSQIKRLRCVVVGCNNEYSSRNLLPTSELLKTQRINVTFILKGMHLNVSMFTRIIRDSASSTDKVSIRVFMNICKSPLLICGC